MANTPTREHDDEPAQVATDTQAREGTTALRGPLTTKGTRVRVNLPESENHGAEGHIVAHDAKTPEYEWRVQFDESRRDDGDVWFRTDQLVPVGDPATPAPAGDADVSQCPGCTSGRAEQCELRDGHAELSHEEAMDYARHYAGRDSMLFRYVSQQEARQLQAEQRIAEYKASEADWREKLRATQEKLEAAEKEVAELQAGYPDACDKFQSQLRSIAAQRDELSRKLEAAERQVEQMRARVLSTDRYRCKQVRVSSNAPGLPTYIRCGKHSGHDMGHDFSGSVETSDPVAPIQECAPPAQPPPAKPLTPDDVRTIAREVIAEVAERACVACAADGRGDGSGYPLGRLAEAAKEENGD